MGRSIVGQVDRCLSLQRFAVDHDARHASTDAVRVLDGDLVTCGVVLKGDVEAWPPLRYAGGHDERGSAETKSQYPFESCPIHPSRRAGVPCPPPAADVRRFRVDIGA